MNQHIESFNIKFENIPMMTVIAGINGIGKTTLLTAISDQLEKENKLFIFSRTNNKCDQLDRIKSEYEQMISQKCNKLQDYALKRNFKDFIKEEEYENYFRKIEEMNLINNDSRKQCEQVISEMNPPNSILKLNYENYIEQLNKLMKISSPENMENHLQKLNDFFEKEKYKYKIRIQKENFDAYNSVVKLIDKHGSTVDCDNLSDGEKILITQLFWKFEGYPKLNEEIVFLLDEPDCHLHPCAVKQLIEAIQNLASKMKIQIIMTTQNPITLNYVYEDSLFIMNYTDENENEISIVKASDSRIHPSKLLTSDLIAIHRKFYQIYVQSENDKNFFEILNEKQNLSKHVPIMFKAISEEKKSPLNDTNLTEDSRYKILNLFDSILVDNCLRKELDYIREFLTNRLEILKDSPESKIIDMMDIVEGNDQLKFMFGLIDRRTSIIKNGRKKRIIYLDRYDTGNYIFDPYHVYLLLTKLRPESDIVKCIQSLNEHILIQEWHQTILNSITSAIKKQICSSCYKELDFETKKVTFSHPKMELEYEKFLLDTDSSVLLELLENAFSTEPSEQSQKNIKLANQEKFSILSKIIFRFLIEF